MKEKTVKSPYGIWTVIYEVKSGGRTFWFNEAEIDSAELRFKASPQTEEEEEPYTIQGRGR